MKLVAFLIPAVLVSGTLGFGAGYYTHSQGVASEQLAIMQAQKAEADAQAAKQKKMIESFGKALAN